MFGPPHQSNSIVWGELNNLPNCRTHLRNEITLSEHTTGVGICNALKKFISDFNSSSTTDFYAAFLPRLTEVHIQGQRTTSLICLVTSLRLPSGFTN
uniref:Uncharacterized protein n=1 Tax=Physcomitrium patens TaxID=3218 RepID=A0A2K1JYA5_PHYPA|nr:hypothetical protein PHYPA_013623 [Physcomitrium patens]